MTIAVRLFQNFFIHIDRVCCRVINSHHCGAYPFFSSEDIYGTRRKMYGGY